MTKQKLKLKILKSSTLKLNEKSRLNYELIKNHINANNLSTFSFFSKDDFFKTEYYDIPYTYNDTTIKILAQNPHTLFIYWDISEKDRNEYIAQYGKDFFYKTKPYLIIKNESNGKSFDIEINDFANSWYVNVYDSYCKYTARLCRKVINNDIPLIKDNVLHIASSNIIEIPNDHVILNDVPRNVVFFNTKTKESYTQTIDEVLIDNKFRKAFSMIYSKYRNIKKEDLLKDLSSSIYFKK